MVEDHANWISSHQITFKNRVGLCTQCLPTPGITLDQLQITSQHIQYTIDEYSTC